jgi:hypothetical protein
MVFWVFSTHVLNKSDRILTLGLSPTTGLLREFRGEVGLLFSYAVSGPVTWKEGNIEM